MSSSKSYDIGISYAYEDADIVKKIVDALEKAGLKVFFDQNEAAKLIGKNLTYTLPEIYSKQCAYCLMFVSHFYAEKRWTNYERDWLFQKRIDSQKDNVYTDCIIPVFIEHTEMPGLNAGIVGFDVHKQSPDEIASIMYEKIKGKKLISPQNNFVMSDVFQNIYTKINSFLENQSDCTYKIEKYSEYDVTINLHLNCHNFFMHLVNLSKVS